MCLPLAFHVRLRVEPTDLAIVVEGVQLISRDNFQVALLNQLLFELKECPLVFIMRHLVLDLFDELEGECFPAGWEPLLGCQ